MVASKNNPASICWSWRRLQDMPWRRLHHVFSVKTLRLPRLLENVLKTSWRCLKDILHNVFKTSCKTSWEPINCYAEDVLKISWRHVLKTSWRYVLMTSWRPILKTSWRYVMNMPWRYILTTSWRHYGEKQNTYWGPNKSKYVSNKSIFHKSISDNSKANPKCIN